jgi:ribosome-associated translation inhibitor RaiA
MQIPLQISFENAEPSEALRAAIRREVDRLEKYQHHIIGCRVAVVAPSTKHRHGSAYRINIWLTIPPHENIVVSHQPSDDQSHVHVEVAIKDAFAAARHQIEDLLNRDTNAAPATSAVKSCMGRAWQANIYRLNRLRRSFFLVGPALQTKWSTAQKTCGYQNRGGLRLRQLVLRPLQMGLASARIPNCVLALCCQ